MKAKLTTDVAGVQMYWIGILVLLTLSLTGCSLNSDVDATPDVATSEPATFRNPLNASGPDPWMTYYEGHYYLATTTWGDAKAGLSLRKAATIDDLKKTPPTTIYTDTTPSRCCNFWAPEFFLLDGPNGKHWYGYYTAGTQTCCDGQRIHVVESAGTDLMGPYTYRGELADAQGGWAIDGSILQLDGGLYLLFSSWVGDQQSLFIAPMSDPWTVNGKRVLISAPEYDWEMEKGYVNEGPVALQRDGKTLIVYSASACWGSGYKLGMLAYTGGDPLTAAAWKKAEKPVFEGANGVYAPGHNNFFKSPDGTEDWMIYHANTSAYGACDMNRTPRIQKITWNADGTPNFGSPIATDSDVVVPSGE